MKSGKLKSLVRILILVSVSLAGGRAAEAGNLKLIPVLTTELNAVLKASDYLHRSLVLQSDEQVEMGIRDLLWQLERARAASTAAKEHERRHLVRIVESARDHFELSQTAYGNERRGHLERGFNQIVNLVRIYKLDRSYGIFFCPKDRASWVQKGWQAKHPFRPDTNKDCGIRVPN